jgi:hypothetical protein
MISNIIDYLFQDNPFISNAFANFIADFNPFLGRFDRSFRLPVEINRKRFCRRMRRRYLKLQLRLLWAKLPDKIPGINRRKKDIDCCVLIKYRCFF